jgi:hypothetical protein
MTTAAATRENERGCGYNRYGQLRSFKSVRFGARRYSQKYYDKGLIESEFSAPREPERFLIYPK